MNKIQLGKSKLMVTPVGMGTLTMGFSQKNLSIEEGSELIVYAVENGINFIDTAQYYDTYRFLAPALKKIRAEKATEFPVICSKTLETSYSDAMNAVDECLNELELECIDIFLLHEVRGINDWISRDKAWQALKAAKSMGKIKAIGISTHHVDACIEMATVQECDVVFTLINKTGMGIRNGDKPGSRNEMETAIKVCADFGIGVFSMKAFGGGNLIEEYISCLDYATNVPGSSAVMIGMGNKNEIDKAIAYFESRLPATYVPDITGKKMMIDQSDCEGCGTCKARCVSKAIFWNENGLAEINPDKCVRCGYCAPVCPVRAIVFL